jgi:hypothetical protein
MSPIALFNGAGQYSAWRGNDGVGDVRIVGGLGGGSTSPLAYVTAAGLNGAVSGQNVCMKAFSPAATIVADGNGVAQAVTGGATFTNADFFNNTWFVANKIGLVLAIPTSGANETDGNLVCVIGGAGGSAPYNRTFVLDLSNAGTTTVTPQIATTVSAA